MMKEYGGALRNDPTYADKAARVSALAKDPAESLAQEDLSNLGIDGKGRKIAFHCPCTLQHGQKLPDLTKKLLNSLGFILTEVENPHLCCGSAGTYSILQNQLSQQLLTQKLHSLQTPRPELIAATANIGCQLHLQSAAKVPVLHWLELFDATQNPK